MKRALTLYCKVVHMSIKNLLFSIILYSIWIFLFDVNRGANAENDYFLGKSNAIVRHQFRDFPEFETSWLLKVTWENMTLSGDQSKVIE